MMCYKRFASLLAAVCVLCVLASCKSDPLYTKDGGDPGRNGDITVNDAVPTVSGLDTSNLFSDRDLAGAEKVRESDTAEIRLKDGGSSSTSSLVTVKKDVITITGAGVFRVSGKLSDGRIVVDAAKDDKVQLLFDNVSINCNTSAALYVRQADKAFVTLTGDGNVLSNAADFVAVDDNSIDGVVFSKDDLTFNGTGKLTVRAAYGHGIVCKDSLTVTGGSYEITAASHAIQAKDDVSIADGTLVLTAGKDGIHAENADDAALGNLYIGGGRYTVTAQGDGFSASGILQIDGGTGTIKTGGGAATTASANNKEWFWNRGSDTGNTASAKGMKATANLLVKGGTWQLDTADDGLHSNASMTVTSGKLTVAAGDDGLHADVALVVAGGTVTVTQSYEGLEGTSVEITGGTIRVTASDDGINAAGGADQSGYGGRMPGRDGFGGSSDTYIRISGGKTTVNAAGDGVDSNGSVVVSGGETYISGPTDSGNAALDYESGAQITGGIFVAAGSTGMAENFTSADGQGAILAAISGSAGSTVTLADSAGKELLSYAPDKAFSCIVISCPALQRGSEYSLSAGTRTVSLSLTDWLYTADNFGGMGGRGGPGDRGGRGGMGGDPPDRPGGSPPDMR